MMKFFLRQSTLKYSFLVSISLLSILFSYNIINFSEYYPIETIIGAFSAVILVFGLNKWSKFFDITFDFIISHVIKSSNYSKIFFVLLFYVILFFSVSSILWIVYCQYQKFKHESFLKAYAGSLDTAVNSGTDDNWRNVGIRFSRYIDTYPNRDDIYIFTATFVDAPRGVTSPDQIRSTKRRALSSIFGQVDFPELPFSKSAFENGSIDGGYAACDCKKNKYRIDRAVFFARLWMESRKPPDGSEEDEKRYIREIQASYTFLNALPPNNRRDLFKVIHEIETSVRSDTSDEDISLSKLSTMIDDIRFGINAYGDKNHVIRSFEYHMALDYAGDGHLRKCDNKGKRLAAKYFGRMLKIRNQMRMIHNENQLVWLFPHQKLGLFSQIIKEKEVFLENKFAIESVSTTEKFCKGSRKFVLDQLRRYGKIATTIGEEYWIKGSVFQIPLVSGKNSLLKTLSLTGWRH